MSILAHIPAMSDDLSGHSERTADLAVDIAVEMGMNQSQLRAVWLSAHLHDVGKVQIPAEVLDLPRPLLAHERTTIERHPSLGFLLLDGLVDPAIARAVLCHHERIDGLGYPFGLSGERIPRMARIIAVADAVDAIVSDRVYQASLPMAVALFELEAHAGTQFDPDVVNAAFSVLAADIATVA